MVSNYHSIIANISGKTQNCKFYGVKIKSVLLSFLFSCSDSLSHWKSYPTCLRANVVTTTAVHLYYYCNITQARVWRLCSSRGCLQHSLQAALHRPPGCKSASVYFAKFVHSCRERRTAPQLAAGSAALQLSQLGHSWGSAAADSWAAALQ